MASPGGKSPTIEHVDPITIDDKGLSSNNSPPTSAQPGVQNVATADEIEEGRRGWFSYLRTKNFYIVLLLGLV